MTVAVIDTGTCNLHSMARAIEECGSRPVVTADPADLARANHIVLPGVGAFPQAMANLISRGLDSELCRQVRDQRIPLLAVCLGMQLLCSRSFEIEETAGLGLIDADVIPLEPMAESERVPHVGWNEVIPRSPSRLFQGIPEARDFYFVHSYVVVCKDDSEVAGTTPYCGGFTSAIERAHVYGVQFHPEKSQRWGLKLLSNFLSL